MKVRLLLLIAVLLMISGARPLHAASKGYIRVANASSDAGNLDVYLDGNKVGDKLAFKDFTDFMELDAKTYDVAVRLAGAAIYTKPLITKQVNLSDGAWLNLVVIGLLNGKNDAALDLGVYPSDHSPTNGKARLEVINTISGFPSIDILQNDNALVSGIAFGKGVVSADFDQGNYDVQLVPTGTTGPALKSLSVQGVGDVIYTDLLVGTLLSPDVMYMDYGKMLLRVVNVSPDSGPIDVYLNGKKTFENLTFKSVTDFKPMDAGNYDIAVRSVGAAPDSLSLTKAKFQLPAGSAIRLEIFGLVSGKGTQVFQIYWASPSSIFPEGKGRIAVINASPDAPGVDVLNGENVITTNLAYGDGYGWYVTPGSYDLTITPTGKKNAPLLSLKGIAIAPDSYYVIFAANMVSKIEAVTMIDQSYAAMTGTEPPSTIAATETTTATVTEIPTETSTVAPTNTATETLTETPTDTAIATVTEVPTETPTVASTETATEAPSF